MSIACEYPTNRRLHLTLRTFENQHVVCLTARPRDARDGGNEEHRADGGGVLVLWGAKIGRKPRRQPLDAIPLESVHIIPNGMEAMPARFSCDGIVNGVL